MGQKTICHMNNPCNGLYGKCLDVKITNECNGSCRFCIESGGFSPANAPVGKLIKSTNALTDYQKVLILGGEPFLYPHLIEYLEGIREKQEIYITTNGSAFHKWPIDQIARNLTAVNISVHYYSQAGNSSVLGTHVDFIDVYEAIKAFKNAGVKVRINSNLIKGALDNKLDVKFMISAARNLGADEIRFAELQHCPGLFVSAEGLFDDMLETKFPEDPFSLGCERLVFDDEKFKVWLRLACGLVNPNRAVPICPERNGSQTKVLYPDGTVSDGWLQRKAPSGKRKSDGETSSWGCH